jgi:hypothetical protein
MCGMTGSLAEIKKLISSQMGMFVKYPADGPMKGEIGDSYYTLKWPGHSLTFRFTRLESDFRLDEDGVPPVVRKTLTGNEIATLVKADAVEKSIKIQ